MARARRQPLSPLAALNAYGLTSPWIVWRIAGGKLDDTCPTCRGRGEVVRRGPCGCREPYGVWMVACRWGCSATRGCTHCLRPCGTCRGTGELLGVADVHAEDFGDADSRALAEALIPGLDIDERKRIDMDAPALGGRR